MKIIQNILLILVMTTVCSFSRSTITKLQTYSTEDITKDTILCIKFHELSLSINRLEVYDIDNNIDQVQKDTVILQVAVGETIEAQKITVSTDQLTNVSIEQCYETSVTIMNEGPHCDLTEWKHFHSDWKQLNQLISGQYICDKYSLKDGTFFPKISMKDLKKKVKEQCGDEWFKLVEKIESPTEYPSGVGISRYFLRVTGQRKDNGQTVTKLIIIETPMGC